MILLYQDKGKERGGERRVQFYCARFTQNMAIKYTVHNLTEAQPPSWSRLNFWLSYLYKVADSEAQEACGLARPLLGTLG